MYDTIIIGRDLSSLIAALAALRHGLKTLLITEGNQETEHRDAGYAFPIDPTPLSGFGGEQTVLRLLGELHLSLTEAPKMLLMDPAFQVILPGHRVDLFHDQNQMINEMIREFPSQEREIKRVYHAVLKYSTLIEHWISEDRAGRSDLLTNIFRYAVRLPNAIAGFYSLALRSNGTDHALDRVIEAQMAVLSHLDVDSRFLPLSAAYLLSLPTRGVYYPLGGRNAWLSWLRKVYIDSGGELLDGYSVMRIDTKPEIIVDVEYAGSASTIHGNGLIVSAQWEKLNLLLFQQKAFRSVVRRLGFNRPNAPPFCLHLGVHEEGLPERMAPYVAVVPDDRIPSRHRNLVFIERSLQGEISRAPEGRRALSVTVFLKESPLVLDDSELKAMAKTMIDALEGFLPFLRESIDYVNIEKSIAVARQSQEIVNQKYRMRKRSNIAMNTLSPVTPLHNVLLTGGIFRAGLGFEGEILSGMDAALLAGKELRSHGQ
jgi:phytoene dehydrogenase-like protein